MKANHIRINYYKGEVLTSVLLVDYRNNKVEVFNYTDEILDRALGANEDPTIQDFEGFLEERCFPRSRDRYKELLRVLNIACYDPYEIVKVTHGVTHEDLCWLEIVEE